MKSIKIKFTLFFSAIALLGFVSTVYADTDIHLSIKTPTSTIYDQNITVVPCDSDKDASTPDIATPYCAILQSGIPNDWSWNASLGYYLNSLNNISGSTTKDRNGNDVYHYWSWSIGPDVAMVGLSAYELKPSDIISLNFIDPADPTPPQPTGSGPLLTPSDIPPVNTTATLTPSSGSTPAMPAKPSFNVQKAFDFLISQQKNDGSFGEDIYTDWVAMALASGNYQDQTIKLIKYFGKSKIENASLTDYERRAMALMSLGLNPYNTNGENYIDKITTSFDEKQFGDLDKDNDDIFALIVLQNAGFTQTDKIINDDISFVLSKQKENGSWDESPDMTGAGIEALSAFDQDTSVKNALTKAEDYLKQNQKDDGGWGNASSTAWALEGILALNEKPENWLKNGNNPSDYLASIEDTNGGIKNESMTNKVWETAYTLSSLSGKNWNQIMQKFEKEEKPAVIPAENKNESAQKAIIQEKTVPKLKNEIIATDKKPENVIKNNLKTKSENKISENTTQNTATAINAVAVSEPTTKTEIPQKGWFTKLLKSVFGI